MTNSREGFKAKLKAKSKNFGATYDGFCAVNGTYPVKSVRAFVQDGILDINGDKLGHEDWKPLCEALGATHDLKFIAIRSFWKLRDCVVIEKSARNAKCSEAPPPLHVPATIHNLMKSLNMTLIHSLRLTCLELQGIPLTLFDLELLSKGLSQNHSVQHLSFYQCRIGDNGLKVICRAIMRRLNITSVDFSYCGLTELACHDLVSLLKHQTVHRHSMTWKETLRQDIAHLDNMGGLQRLTLNGNPLIGDKGARLLADSLNDNLWLRAIDIQGCGIQDSGARALLNTLKYNTTVYILDIRKNFITSHDLLLRISQQLHFNTQGQTSQFKWLKCSKLDANGVKICRKKRGIPWRVAARFNSSRHFHSHVPGIANVYNQSQPSLLGYSSDDKSEVLSNASIRQGKKAMKPKGRNDEILTAIQDELSELRAKLLHEIAARKLVESKMCELLVENENLKGRLEKEDGGGMPLDDVTLNAIENVFLKFSNFLSVVQEVGYDHLIRSENQLLEEVGAAIPLARSSDIGSKKSDISRVNEIPASGVMGDQKTATSNEMNSRRSLSQSADSTNVPSLSKDGNRNIVRFPHQSLTTTSSARDGRASASYSRKVHSNSNRIISASKEIHQASSLSDTSQNSGTVKRGAAPISNTSFSINRESNEEKLESVGTKGSSSSISTHFSTSSATGSFDDILVISDKF